MDRLPFSVYDFFGYLASGFVALVALAAAFTGDDGWQQTPSTIVALVFVVVAYLTGHVVANAAGFLLESKLVGRGLGPPAAVLFETETPRLRGGLFPGYYRPLQLEQRERVLELARAAGIPQPGQGLFLHCFARAKTDATTMHRLSTFLNLYGFARNMVEFPRFGGQGLFRRLVCCCGR